MAVTLQDVAGQFTGKLKYTLPPAHDVTVRVWATFNGLDYDGVEVIRFSESSLNYLILRGDSSNTLELIEFPGEHVLATSIPILRNQWQLLVWVVSDGIIKIYQDGELYSQSSLNGNLEFQEILFSNNQSQLWDELLYVPRATSEAQIVRWSNQDEPDVSADPGGNRHDQWAVNQDKENPPDSDSWLWKDTADPVGDGDVLWMRHRWVEGDGAAGDWSAPVRVSGEKGDDAYQIQILSQQGTVFKRNQPFNTTLVVRVWQSGIEITDYFDEADFRWSRSSSNAASDQVWNSHHYSLGGKTLEVSHEDIEGDTVFNCSLLRKKE